MSEKSPKITVDPHYPTGGANVTIRLWVTEEEEAGDLFDRILAEETLVHDRERTVNALRLAKGGDP